MTYLELGSPGWFQDMVERHGPLIKANGYDDCVIGVACNGHSGPVLIYDREMIIQSIVCSDECSREDAEEHFEFNIAGSIFEGCPSYLEV